MKRDYASMLVWPDPLSDIVSKSYSAYWNLLLPREETALITQNLFQPFNHLRGLVGYGLC